MSNKAQVPQTSPAPGEEPRIATAFTEGGREIDRPPSVPLFAFLVAMVIVIVASIVFVYQLFVAEADKEQAATASVPVEILAKQRARDLERATTYGVVTVEGQTVGYRVPVAEARALVLRDPARFAPAPAPAGWVHPDDAPAAPAASK